MDREANLHAAAGEPPSMHNTQSPCTLRRTTTPTRLVYCQRAKEPEAPSRDASVKRLSSSAISAS